MIKYTRMFLYKQDSKYALGSKIRQNSEYDKVLNMLEYALTELWIYLRFWICQYFEYGRFLNMQELHKVLNVPQYGWICFIRTWIAWICLNLR